jgi:2-dehydro-3-deoxy-D-gluconate 5-dehydrogenase
MLAEFNLAGRVALVSGGNGGIGRHIVLGLARAGAEVAIAARDQQKAAAVVAEVEALGRRAMAIPCDVGRPKDAREAVEQACAAFGRLDIVVNNAGIGGGGRIEAVSPEVWDAIYHTNVTGAMLLCRAAYPALQAARGGKIINVGSASSLLGWTMSPAYAASKAALTQLTKTLAVAWAADNIQVNTLLPGFVDTGMTAFLLTQMPAWRKRIAGRTIAGCIGSPDAVTGAAIFLASPAADFMTGQDVVVDGGLSLRSADELVRIE